MEIHIVRGENQSGPYTVEQVQDYLAQGILLPDDLAWHDGLTDWIPLSQVMDSVGAPAASPPPEPVAVTPESIEPEPSMVEALEAAPAKAGGNKKLLIGIGAGVAVLAIAAAVWFFFIREKDTGTANPQVAQQPQSKSTNNAPTPNPPNPNPNEPTNSPPPPVLPPVTNTPPPPNPQPGTNLPPLPPTTNLPPLPPATNLPPLPPITNAPPPVDPGPDKPIKELTAMEAAEVMAYDIGQWETKGKGMSAGDEPHPIEMTMEASWKEEGKSVEYKFTVMEDGKPVHYFGHKEYDEAKGIFIYRTKWGENPESTSHERYDAETQTYHAQSAPTQPPSESTSITVTKRMGKDKTRQTLSVLQNGQLVYSHEIISTRKAGQPETPKPAPPDPSEKKPGTVLWEFEAGGYVGSSPAIGSDGTVYVGSQDKKVYALDGETGIKKWEFETESYVGSSPVLSADGILYVGSNNRRIYAIKTASKGLSKSPWPMHGQNPQHTGRAAK